MNIAIHENDDQCPTGNIDEVRYSTSWVYSHEDWTNRMIQYPTVQ